jgi:hypothetical protein
MKAGNSKDIGIPKKFHVLSKQNNPNQNFVSSSSVPSSVNPLDRYTYMRSVDTMQHQI